MRKVRVLERAGDPTAMTHHANPLQLTVVGAEQLSTVRAAIRTWLGLAVDRDGIEDILLATGEALANAVEHALPPVVVRLQWSGIQTLTISVKDAGHWKVAATRPYRGRGIAIMTALMDDVTIDTIGGTTVWVTRDFGR